MEEEEKTIQERTKEEVEKIITNILNEGIQTSNIEFLYKVVDIHKDLSNEEYWEKEGENMRYRGYGNYSGYEDGNYGEYGNYGESYGRRGVPGTGRRRYSEGGSYGRRGVDAKYRGEDMLDQMYQGYREYNDGKEMYGADSNTMESFKYMLKAFKDYYKHLKQEASSQEEVEMLENTAREIIEM